MKANTVNLKGVFVGLQGYAALPSKVSVKV